MYDVTNADTFKSVPNWFLEVERSAPANVCIVIVGNKLDQITGTSGGESKRQVSMEEAQALADERGVPFIETSAKDTMNVDKMFETMTRAIIEQMDRRSSKGGGRPQSDIDADQQRRVQLERDSERKKSGCCSLI